MKNRIFLIFIVFSFSLVTVNALLMEKCASKEFLKENVDYIIVGKVTHVESKWDSEKTNINTYISIDIEQYEKGSGPDKIVVIQHGGRVGFTAMLAEDTAEFKQGEKVRLYLFKSEGDDYYRLYCSMVGKETLEEANINIPQKIIDFFKNIFR